MGSLCQAFLVETMENGTTNRCVIEATHILQRLNLELFQKALITLKQVKTTLWSEKNKNINQQNCHGQVFSLYANGLVLSMQFMTAMIEMT